MAHDVRNPHIFVDGPGNTASGDQVMDNFDALWTARDLLAPPGRITGGGRSIISATGTRTNTVYGALSNGPDQVAGIVLPTDGILEILFRAYWLSSVASVGRAAVFLGANQVKHPQGNVAAGQLDEAGTSGTINQWLSTDGHGLLSTDGGTFGTEGTDAVTTGLVIGQVNTAGTVFGGGPMVVEAAAGTYTVSVQFKSSSGSVTVGGRKLWVVARDFS
jgi:hypothetical protein